MIRLEIITDQGTLQIEENIGFDFVSGLTLLEDRFEIRKVIDSTDVFKVEDVCKLYEKGELVLTGYISEIEIQSNGILAIRGVSKTWILTKGMLPTNQSGVFNKLIRLRKIVETICNNVGIEVKYETEINEHVYYKVIERDRYIVDGIFDLIKDQGLYMSSSADGKLVVTETPILDDPTIKIRDDAIIDYKMRVTASNRGREYSLEGQFGARFHGGTSNLINTELGSSTLDISKYDISDRVVDSRANERSNIQTLLYNEGSIFDIEIKVRQDFPWKVGQKVQINKPILKFTAQQPFMIETVEFVNNENESYATYNLVDPIKYQGVKSTFTINHNDTNWAKYNK